MRSQSSIFTDAEWHALKLRLSGDYSDPTGIFANRVRPKLLEIASWRIPPLKKHLDKVLEQIRETPVEEAAKPNDEQSFEEFKQGIGY